MRRERGPLLECVAVVRERVGAIGPRVGPGVGPRVGAGVGPLVGARGQVQHQVGRAVQTAASDHATMHTQTE